MLLLCHKYMPSMGGLQIYAEWVARTLQEEGHDVTVWTTTAEAPGPGFERINGVAVRRFRPVLASHTPMFATPGMLPALLRREARRADVVHSIGFLFAFTPIAWMLRSFFGVRWSVAPVFSFYPRTRERWLYERLFGRPLLRAADLVMPHSQGEVGIMRERGFRFRRLEVVPYGIDPSFRRETAVRSEDPSWRTRHPLSGRFPLILFVGKLMSSKGCFDLVEAMALLRRRMPGAAAILVGGETSERAALHARIEELGLADHVACAGIVRDPAEKAWLFEQASVVAFPSQHEQFGIVGIEAAASGRPLAATPVGVLPEIAEGLGIGLVHAFGDPEGLATNLARLAEDGSFRERAERQRDQVFLRYLWPNVARRTVRLLSELAMKDPVKSVDAPPTTTAPGRGPETT